MQNNCSHVLTVLPGRRPYTYLCRERGGEKGLHSSAKSIYEHTTRRPIVLVFVMRWSSLEFIGVNKELQVAPTNS